MTNVRGSWSAIEDGRLRSLVNRHRIRHLDGQISWASVSNDIGTRTAKQCRERWINHLNESINKSPLTEGEERYIIQMKRQQSDITYVQIADMLPGRTPLIVKNFIYRDRAKKSKSSSRIRKRMEISSILNA